MNTNGKAGGGSGSGGDGDGDDRKGGGAGGRGRENKKININGLSSSAAETSEGSFGHSILTNIVRPDDESIDPSCATVHDGLNLYSQADALAAAEAAAIRHAAGEQHDMVRIDLRSTPGAFRVYPSDVSSCASSAASDGISDEISSSLSTITARTPVVYSNENLPPNIDIIAEATLVKEGSSGAIRTRDIESGAEAEVTTANETTEDKQPLEASKVYEATLVNDGPFAFLHTKSGKIVGALIVLFSVGLSVGLTGRGSRNTVIDPPSSTETTHKDLYTEKGYKILTYAAANFCGTTSAPQIFYDMFPSICTREELSLGGTNQQAIAIAVHRPHTYCDTGNTTISPEYTGEPITEPNPFLCQISSVTPDISLINGGAVRGEISADSPITNETIYTNYPFPDDTIAYLLLTKKDVVKVLNNALDFVTQEDPLQYFHSFGYPYASGLRYDVDLSNAESSKVSDVRVFEKSSNSWVPILEQDRDAYWIVTNKFIAAGGDNYLDGVEPLYNGHTDLKYVDEVLKYLENLDGSWVPPTLDEMSTNSFSGNKKR